jgi:hypothetical protein
MIRRWGNRFRGSFTGGLRRRSAVVLELSALLSRKVKI